MVLTSLEVNTGQPTAYLKVCGNMANINRHLKTFAVRGRRFEHLVLPFTFCFAFDKGLAL